MASMSLEEQIKALKAQKRKEDVATAVEEKFTELREAVSSNASLETVEPIARSLINFLNERRVLSGKKGKRGRKPKDE